MHLAMHDAYLTAKILADRQNDPGLGDDGYASSNAGKLGTEVDLHAMHHRRSQGHEMILRSLNLPALTPPRSSLVGITGRPRTTPDQGFYAPFYGSRSRCFAVTTLGPQPPAGVVQSGRRPLRPVCVAAAAMTDGTRSDIVLRICNTYSLG